MTQDEIIEMARQAGIPFNKWGMIGCEDCEQDIDQNLAAFAKLVAAKEREACAELALDAIAFNGGTAQMEAHVYQAIRVRGNP